MDEKELYEDEQIKIWRELRRKQAVENIENNRIHYGYLLFRKVHTSVVYEEYFWIYIVLGCASYNFVEAK